MRRVLIVDDHEGLRRVLHGLVVVSGNDPYVAADIADAVAVLERVRIDLVLTDYQLERENGIELAALVRERWPWIPVALMSGALDDDVEARARAVGVIACVPKPFPPTALAQLLGSIARPPVPAIHTA